jgi:hypothetical protein
VANLPLMERPYLARELAWRSFGARRAAALAIAGAAVLTACAFLPGRLSAVNSQVSSFAALSPADRVLGGARSVDVDTGIFKLARRVIPPGAPYYVVTGPGVSVSTPVTYAAASALGALYLLPRIQVNDPRLARYVISYGGDVGALGVRTGRTWTYKPGLEVAEVLR